MNIILFIIAILSIGLTIFSVINVAQNRNKIIFLILGIITFIIFAATMYRFSIIGLSNFIY